MIYLQNTDNSQDVLIPRSLPTPSGASLSLVLHSTMGEGETTLSVSDSSASSKYYKFAVILDGLHSGEYEYRVIADSGILAQGLCRILDTTDTEQVEYNQYDAATIAYKQYGITE